MRIAKKRAFLFIEGFHIEIYTIEQRSERIDTVKVQFAFDAGSFGVLSVERVGNTMAALMPQYWATRPDMMLLCFVRYCGKEKALATYSVMRQMKNGVGRK